MKLSMWMIANRLYKLDPELHIPDNAPANLLSARMVYATNCVYVHQKGNDVICEGDRDGGYIIFHDMDCSQVFEMIQFTFDFYSTWQDMLFDAENELDYDQVIQKSHTIFQNPIVLMDSSYNVLSMSKEYKGEDVNEDWSYLSKNKQSSVDVIRYLMWEGGKYEYYQNASARVYYFDNKNINGNMMTASIYYRDELCGRINIIEKDRAFNRGDQELLNYMVRFLSGILGKINEQKRDAGGLLPLFEKMILGKNISEKELSFWKEITGWNDSEPVYLYVFRMREEADAQAMQSLNTLLQVNIRGSVCSQRGDHIAMALSSAIRNLPETENTLQNLADRFDLSVGISLPAEELQSVSYFYRQALAAVNAGSRADTKERFFDYYRYAVNDLIFQNEPVYMQYACHPDIRSLWKKDTDDGGADIAILSAYLEQERSLLNASRQLFMHRNTFVYRIRKVLEKLTADINDSYSREYMQLSIRIITAVRALAKK